MSFSRKKYDEICGKCKHHKFDKERGIVCSLTDNYADFEIRCNSFELDTLKEKRTIQSNKAKENNQDKLIKKNKYRNIIGIIMIAFGGIFLFASISIGKFSVVGLGLLLTGLFAVAFAQKYKTGKKNRNNEVEEKE